MAVPRWIRRIFYISIGVVVVVAIVKYNGAFSSSTSAPSDNQ
ncbi:hypothetical protein [Mycoplasma suis]|nr:hypothetical protein [Mycoplasma suis]